MRTEAIYDAISGFEEAYVSAAENTDAIRLSFRKHRTRQIQMIGTACACAAVMLAAGWIGSQGWFGKRPPAAPGGFVTGENISVSDDLTTLHAAKEQTEARESTSDSDDPITEQTQNRPTTAKEPSTTEPAKETESRNSKTENHGQTSPTVNQNQQETRNVAPQTRLPVSTRVVERPTDSTRKANSDAPPTSRPVLTEIVKKTTDSFVASTLAEATTVVNPKKEQYKDVSVNYDTAKAYFKHPIVRCERNDLTGYSVLLYHPNGDFNEPGTKCLSVTYLFTNGSIVLNDQDKTGKITPTGTQQEYRGKTFYVHMPEFNGDQIRIGYFPTGGSGLAYQAHFNSRADVNEIMDLILSLEM